MKIFTGYHPKPGDPNSLVSDTITVLKKDDGDQLWVGTFFGLDEMNTKAGTFKHYQNNPNDTTSLSLNVVTAIFKEKNGNIWVGTNGTGLNLLNKQTGKFKRYLQYVTYVNSIYEDSQGVLWIGTNSGLLQYNRETDSFSVFPDEFSVFNNSFVGWIVEDRDQNLWMVALRVS